MTVITVQKRILVVDGDPDIRQVLSDRRNSLGYAVETANDGRDALDVLKMESFDGMLLDMKVGDGQAALDILQAEAGSEV